jgi:hypothetical protein
MHDDPVAVERFPIEAGHVMAFARALGDPNPVYQDAQAAAESEPGVLIAPPTFTVAGAQWDPDYPLRPQPGQPWHGSASGPGHLPDHGRWLHAEQEFVYHRTLRVGDVLTARVRPGAAWTKQGRSGRLQFTEHLTEYRDGAGELVVTARAVAVQQLPEEQLPKELSGQQPEEQPEQQPEEQPEQQPEEQPEQQPEQQPEKQA